MKKMLSVAVLALLVFSSNAYANTESIVAGPLAGDEFTLIAKNSITHEGVVFGRLLANPVPTFDIAPDTTFDGTTLGTLLAGYATTGAMAAMDARVDTLEGSGFTGDYNDLANKPSLFSGAYTDLTGKPSLFSGAYTDLTGKPSLFSGAYSDLTGKPTLFSGSYTDLTSKPTIPTTFDQLTDGSTNKAFTSTMSTKLAGIATGATVNSSDATLLARANHTGAQAESTVTNLTTDLANRPTMYAGATLKSSAKMIVKHATVASGVAVFYLTSDETSGGSALCTNVYDDSINVFVNDATSSYQMSYALTNANKTLTVTTNKLSTANILTGILGQSAANGAVVKLQVSCD